MAESIPVKFEYEGKTYDGSLSPVTCGGTNVWHLTINNFYRGSLTFSADHGWRFTSPKGHFMNGR